jgi:cell division protein FtsB
LTCAFPTRQALRDQNAQRRAEADREVKRRERLEREMKDLVSPASTFTKL